jgi:hypothetical protein
MAFYTRPRRRKGQTPPIGPPGPAPARAQLGSQTGRQRAGQPPDGGRLYEPDSNGFPQRRSATATGPVTRVEGAKNLAPVQQALRRNRRRRRIGAPHPQMPTLRRSAAFGGSRLMAVLSKRRRYS